MPCAQEVGHRLLDCFECRGCGDGDVNARAGPRAHVCLVGTKVNGLFAHDSSEMMVSKSPLRPGLDGSTAALLLGLPSAGLRCGEGLAVHRRLRLRRAQILSVLLLRMRSHPRGVRGESGACRLRRRRPRASGSAWRRCAARYGSACRRRRSAQQGGCAVDARRGCSGLLFGWRSGGLSEGRMK